MGPTSSTAASQWSVVPEKTADSRTDRLSGQKTTPELLKSHFPAFRITNKIHLLPHLVGRRKLKTSARKTELVSHKENVTTLCDRSFVIDKREELQYKGTQEPFRSQC